MINAETLVIDGINVVIDPKNMKFNESNLSEYIIHEAGFYDNFGAYLAKAEYLQGLCEIDLDNIFNERFTFFKEQGMAVAPAESKAKNDQSYIDKRKELVQIKYMVSRLKNHLKAWDKNHDNAQSLGHNRRKEIDKLHAEIQSAGYYHNRDMYSQFDKVDDIVGKD